MRVLEYNKNKTIKIANRIGGSVFDTWGNEIFIYGDIEKIAICLLPIENEVEAAAFGVSLVGGLKSVVPISYGVNFNEFTHIWITTEPDIEKQNTEYVVKAVRNSLGHSLFVIERKIGA